MGSLYKLQAKVWVSNWANKMDFIMTFLFLAVLGSFVVFSSGIDYGADHAKDMQLAKLNMTIIASIVLMMVASSAINTFGISFFEMKDSVLLKRIGATNITKMEAIVAFILWGMTSMVFIVTWMALIVGVCQIGFVADLTGGLLWVDGSIWANANWAGVFVAIIITMISFYAIAFFFVSISKNSMSYQMIATFYFFLISFLGGAYTPNADIAWMNTISFLSPLGWGTDLMTSSIFGADVFSFAGYEVPALIPNENFVSLVNAQVQTDELSVFKAMDNIITTINPTDNFTNHVDMSNTELVNALQSTPFTQDMANEITAVYRPTQITTFYSIGNYLFPVLYGTLAGGFAAKFFKWD